MLESRHVILNEDGTCSSVHPLTYESTQAGTLKGTIEVPEVDPLELLEAPIQAVDALPALFQRGWIPRRKTQIRPGAVLILMQREK